MPIRAIAYRTSIFALVAGGVALSGAARAQTVVSQLTVTAQPGSAAAAAPSQAPTDAVQPTSVVTQSFIANDLPATANYDEIVAITPSVGAVAPNGPGLMENQFLTIRGFQDGQYNLTIDGIAWGDSNDFTHHSTSYVMGHDLGAVGVDRGPGTASTLGDATFGGTIALTTKDPLDRAGLEAYGSIGSFSTYLGGVEFDSGKQDALHGGKAMLDVEHVESDGALSYMGQSRTNLFSKVEVPLSASTTLTFAAMYNQLQQYVGLGATAQQYQTFGYRYGLNDDPTSQAYYRFNRDEITTNLEYIGLTSDLGDGWKVDNKLYSYDYYHLGHNGMDPNGETPNGTYFGANNVPGQVLHNDYISYGDIFRISKDFGVALLKSGFWFDFQHNDRTLVDVDFTKSVGGVLDPSEPGAAGAGVVESGTPVPGVERDQINTLTTFQPYLEADITPIQGLTITPGVKFDYFRRTIDAAVNQGTYLPLDYSKTWTKVLPSLAAHYTVSPSVTVYAQVAQGFLAPNLNTFYTTDPKASTNLQPQTTWNYQAGATYHTNRLILSGDLYYIDFGNMIGKRNVSGVGTVFFNQGGVIYQGVEAEATFRLIGGLSLYANGSVNSAKDKQSHLTIADSPDSTAAGGVLYDQGRLHGSLLAKYTGLTWGDSGEPTYAKFGGYTITDLSLGYTFPAGEHRPAIKLSGLIDNLLDIRGHSALAGYTGAAGTPLYWNIVPRNAELKVSVAF